MDGAPKTRGAMRVELDLRSVPFSRFGSYFSFARLDGKEAVLGEGLYLRTHHYGGALVFKLEPYADGKPIPYELSTTPARIAITTEGAGRIEIVMADPSSIRVRGEGVSLRLEMPGERWRFTYELPGGAWGFDMPQSDAQVALDMIGGALDMDAPWAQGPGFCFITTSIVATLSPGPTGSFEAAIDDFVSTWKRPGRAPFDSCAKEAAAAFTTWARGLPSVSAPRELTRDLAGYVNWSAVVRPYGNLTKPTMLMSKMSMWHVFGWDHVFTAIAHVVHDPELAWDQFMIFAGHEDPFGKFPNNMNDRSISHTFANPPVHGWGLRRMEAANPSILTGERLSDVYRHLSMWTTWWTDHRTWAGEELPVYIHGFDSGWDNSTIFDKGVPLIAPDLAAYLALQLEVLSDLAGRLGKADDAAHWQAKSERVISALLDELWQDGEFVGKVLPSGTVSRCESLIRCMPIILGKRLPKDVQVRLVETIREHLTPWGLATEKTTSSRYQERGYWRGAIWAPTTLIVVSGLIEAGETHLARTIADSFCAMCDKSGFAENFDALTGAGEFDPAYTWTSSVYLILASMTW